MITTANLKNHSKAELSSIAKRLGVQVAGKSKDQLLSAISRLSQRGKLAEKKAAKKIGAGSSSKKGAKPQSKALKTNPSTKATEKTKFPAAGTNKGGKAKTADSKKSLVGQSKPAAPAKPASRKLDSSKVVSADRKPTSANSTAIEARLKTITPKASKVVADKDYSPQANAGAAKVVGNKVPAKPQAAARPVKKPPVSNTSPKVLKKIREMQLQREASKDIGYRPRLIKPPGATDPVFDKEPQKDRVALFVRDPFWMHVCWDITRGAVERAQAALAEQWYGAKPVLRLIRIDDSGATSVSETTQLEIEIRGGVRNWYIPWTGESASFRVAVGYLGVHGRFHVVAQSNIVKTPAASSPDSVDEHWSDLGPDGEKIFALSGGYDNERDTKELQEMLEDRLNRGLGAPTLAKLGVAADGVYNRRGGFFFDMDVELVLYGSTSPDAYLTLNEEPVTLRPDGTFVVRLPFPDRRQVIPAVAVARDGSHQRTIVIGVERNTKIMEPMEQEQDLGD